MRTCRGRGGSRRRLARPKGFPGPGVLRTHIERPESGLVSAASAISAGAYIAVGLGRPRTRVATEATPVSHVEVRSFA